MRLTVSLQAASVGQVVNLDLTNSVSPGNDYVSLDPSGAEEVVAVPESNLIDGAIAVAPATCPTPPAPSPPPLPPAEVPIAPEAGSGAPAQYIEPEVLATVAAQGEAVVILNLAGAAPAEPVDVGALMQQTAAVQERVLSILGQDDFTITYRYEALFALAGRITASGLEKLTGHADVTDILTDRLLYITHAESVPLISANQVHAQGYTGAGIEVAVIDSGVDRMHADLQDSVLSEECYMSGTFPGATRCPNGQTSCVGTGCAPDDNGHGTHVTGTITGNGSVAGVGVAPASGIRAFKVFGPNGLSVSSDWANALNRIITTYSGTDIINMSLSDGLLHPPGCASDVPGGAMLTLRNMGKIIFAASGNEGSSMGMSFPGCAPTAVGVGAVYDANVGPRTLNGCTDAATAADKIACFSNSNSDLDLLAPGALISSTKAGGGTETRAGTSMASPHAAGVAALVWQKQPAHTDDSVESCLKRTGVPILDPRNGITRSRVNALAALDCALDSDGDGVLDGSDNCPLKANPTQQDGDGDGAGDQCDNCIAYVNADQADANGNGVGDACDYANDTDGDGGKDNMEYHAGTSRTLACSVDNIAYNEEPDALLTDFDDDRRVTGADLSALVADIGKAVPPASVRKDIAPDSVNVLDPAGDNSITGADLSRVAAVIGIGC